MARIESVRECVLELLRDNPGIEWTIRQIYYRLVSPPYQLIENKRSAYTNLDRQLVVLRESGEVPDSVIVDSARRVDGGDLPDWDEEGYFWARVAQFSDAGQLFTRAMWKDQPRNVIVVLEKDALSRLVGEVTDSFHVPLAVGRGYSSRTQVLEVMRALDLSKQNHVLYLGDFDPTGRDIERSLCERLLREIPMEEPPVIFERVALTYYQAMVLPPNPTKEADSRQRDYVKMYGDRCWELDALRPKDLQALVRDTITGRVDATRWNITAAEMDKSRARLSARFAQAAEALSGIGGR